MQVIRESDKKRVLLKEPIISREHRLSAALRFRFYLQAGPVKPLPKGWRGWSVQAAGAGAWARAGEPGPVYWTLWGGEPGIGDNPFPPYPDDEEAAKANIQSRQAKGAVVVDMFNNQFAAGDPLGGPFRRERVLLPSMFKANTRATQDYYLHSYNKWITSAGLDGVYIDEAYNSTSGYNVLAGIGYIRPDGSRGMGFGFVRQREFFRRLWTLFHKRRPNGCIWLHGTGFKPLSSIAYVDLWMGGEYPTFYGLPEKMSDFFYWYGSGGRLMAIGSGRQYGCVSSLMSVSKVGRHIDQYTASRSYLALLGLHDILPASNTAVQEEFDRFVHAKATIGIADESTEFIPYWDNRRLVLGSPASRDRYVRPDGNWLISAYLNPPQALFVVVNGHKYDGHVGLTPVTKEIDPEGRYFVLFDAETCESLALSHERGAANIYVPAHDYRLLICRSLPKPSAPSGAKGTFSCSFEGTVEKMTGGLGEAPRVHGTPEFLTEEDGRALRIGDRSLGLSYLCNPDPAGGAVEFFLKTSGLREVTPVELVRLRWPVPPDPSVSLRYDARSEQTLLEACPGLGNEMMSVVIPDDEWHSVEFSWRGPRWDLLLDSRPVGSAFVLAKYKRNQRSDEPPVPYPAIPGHRLAVGPGAEKPKGISGGVFLDQLSLHPYPCLGVRKYLLDPNRPKLPFLGLMGLAETVTHFTFAEGEFSVWLYAPVPAPAASVELLHEGGGPAAFAKATSAPFHRALSKAVLNQASLVEPGKRAGPMQTPRLELKPGDRLRVMFQLPGRPLPYTQEVDLTAFVEKLFEKGLEKEMAPENKREDGPDGELDLEIQPE